MFDIEIKYGLLQVSEGLAFLHDSAKMLHRNISPEAIVINEAGAWKICGFEYCLANSAAPGQEPSWSFPEYDHGQPPETYPQVWKPLEMLYRDIDVFPSVGLHCTRVCSLGQHLSCRWYVQFWNGRLFCVHQVCPLWCRYNEYPSQETLVSKQPNLGRLQEKCLWIPEFTSFKASRGSCWPERLPQTPS